MNFVGFALDHGNCMEDKQEDIMYVMYMQKQKIKNLSPRYLKQNERNKNYRNMGSFTNDIL